MGFVNGPPARKSASAKTCSQTCVCIPKQIHNPKSRTTFHLIYHASPAANTPHAPNTPPLPPKKSVAKRALNENPLYAKRFATCSSLSVCVPAVSHITGTFVGVGNFHLFTNQAYACVLFRLVREKVKTTPQPTLTPFACQLHLAMLSGGCCVCVCFVHEHAREWQ